MNTETKKYSKGDILREINTEREKLENILAQFSDEQLVVGKVIGEWSVKDIISHITAWEQRFVKWKEIIVQGKEPDDYPVTWEEVHARNEESYEVDKIKPLAQTKKEFTESFLQVIASVESIPAEMLEDLEYFEWRKEPFWVMVASNTFWHYREHQEDIKKALENFNKNAS